MNTPNPDPLELAFSDFFNGDKQATITIHNDIGDVVAGYHHHPQ